MNHDSGVLFLNKRTGEVKSAYSVEFRGEKVCVRFYKYGKEYSYQRSNVDILNSEYESQFMIYRFMRKCYKCGNDTSIYTYIIFDDGTDEDVVFPWNKSRLLEHQDIISHIIDPTIEYYGLKVVGESEKFDKVLMDKFPNKIKTEYSNTLKKYLPMNLCDCCGAKQGNFFVYKIVNQLINNDQPIEVYNG